jgi:hypothetical protein
MKISDTGDINTNLLSQYKTSDSIFKSKEIINNEQSHGLIVFIDHSTSMKDIISSVRGQALQIAEFCRITNIPFDVYAFSTHPAALNLLKNRSNAVNRNYKNHALINILSSNMSTQEYNTLFDIIIAEKSNCRTGSIFELQGTPLNSTKLDSIKVVSEFKRKNPTIQKTHVIYITDGAETDANIGHHTRNNLPKMVNYDSKKYIITETESTYKYGFLYRINPGAVLLRDLFKKIHPDVETTNLFLTKKNEYYEDNGEHYFGRLKASKDLSNSDINQFNNSMDKFGIGKIPNSTLFDNEYVISIPARQRNKLTDHINFDELEDDFSDVLFSKKKGNTIARKIAEFIS